MEDVQEFLTRYYRHPILFLTIPEIPPPPPAGGDPNDETIFPYQNDQNCVLSPMRIQSLKVTQYSPSSNPTMNRKLNPNPKNPFLTYLAEAYRRCVCAYIMRTHLLDKKPKITPFSFWWDSRSTNWLPKRPIKP